MGTQGKRSPWPKQNGAVYPLGLQGFQLLLTFPFPFIVFCLKVIELRAGELGGGWQEDSLSALRFHHSRILITILSLICLTRVSVLGI